jgi:hypothetical protein
MRRSHRIAGVIAASFATSVAGVTAVSSWAAAAATAKSSYQAALKAAAAQNVHYVSEATEQGVGSLKVIGDTGKTSGSDVLQVIEGSTTESLKVILVGSTGYIRGNDAALQKVLGFTAAQATTYTNKWLSFPASNTSLAELVSGLRNSDAASELKMSGPYTFGATKAIDGQVAQAINGTEATSSGTTVPIILYVSPSGRPVEEVANPKAKSSSVRDTVTFSKWGEATHPEAPASSVPLIPLLPAA